MTRRCRIDRKGGRKEDQVHKQLNLLISFKLIIVSSIIPSFSCMNRYRFIKEGGNWYIDLPEYLEQGGTKGDLQMVEGADTMLDIISGSKEEVTLLLERKKFEGADRLELVERCDPYIGGGYYLLHSFQGKEYNHRMWLCGVTEFVFGDLPKEIFLRMVP